MSEIVSQTKPGVTRSNTLANIYAGDQQNASFDGERMLMIVDIANLNSFRALGRAKSIYTGLLFYLQAYFELFRVGNRATDKQICGYKRRINERP